ncbi:type II toxin-antitoxin system RelE/ParE family toxin [bacterium]|nr:type II toxin-antitoxin system RelE/ParE family toxin [bacterium]MBL7000754.1 type II toxin-antitoxin system RelE/ParE family toxin [Gammaproteobacteria bacterium]
MPTWSHSAELDLQRNIENYAKEDPVTAWRIFEEVIERAEILDEQPELGRRGRLAGTREFVLKGTPFILVYQGKAPVNILNVLHGHQDRSTHEVTAVP